MKEYGRKEAIERVVMTNELLKAIKELGWPEPPGLSSAVCLYEDISCGECSKTYW